MTGPLDEQLALSQRELALAQSAHQEAVNRADTIGRLLDREREAYRSCRSRLREREALLVELPGDLRSILSRAIETEDHEIAHRARLALDRLTQEVRP